MARVIFVNRFYWPDEPATSQLLTDLAEGLAARGHDVSVIASRPDATGLAANERRGVKIIHVGSTRRGSVGLVGKAVDWGSFLVGCLWHIVRHAGRDSVVVAMTDPPLLGVGARWMAGLRRASLIHWVQDIYPEIAVELTGHRSLRLLRPLRDAAWRNAAHCVTLGTDMADVVQRAGVRAGRISVVRNWAPVGLAQIPPQDHTPLREAWGVVGKFVVAYSGNLGRVHDLAPVLDVAAALLSDSKIVFIFIGHGAQHAQLVEAASQRGLRNVIFQPPQPRAKLAETLAVADVQLVTLRPGCERFVFPSKLHGIAAIGRPLLFIGATDSEVAREVADNSLGYAAAPSDTPGLCAHIRRLASDPVECTRFAAAGLRYAQKHSAETAIQRWDELLTARAGSRPVFVSPKQSPT